MPCRTVNGAGFLRVTVRRRTLDGESDDLQSGQTLVAEAIADFGEKDSKGVPEPLHHPERSPSQENLVFLFPLLPSIENPLKPR